jgi:hypothetical protein
MNQTGEVYTPLPDARGTWAEGAFGDDMAELDGVRAHVVRLGSLISDKSEDRSDPMSAIKDHTDLVVLKSLHGGG